MTTEADDTGESIQRSGPRARIKVYLRATNLPSPLTVLSQQPDTFARVSMIDQSVGTLDETANNPEGESYEDTEVVHKSSNPRWTWSLTIDYEYGTQVVFFVDIYAVRDQETSHKLAASLNELMRKKGRRFLGRATFDVQDVLGTSRNSKAKRLRKGGVVYAHVELQYETSASSPSNRSLALPDDDRILRLRIKAESLVHTQSTVNKYVSRTTAKPDTYFEVARLSESHERVVVFRSATVKESVCPTYDLAVIELNALRSSSECNLVITVFKLKRRKCKAIGSFEASIETLISACRTNAKVSGFEGCEDAEVSSPGLQLRRGGGESAGKIVVLEASIEHPSDTRESQFLSGADNDGGAPGELALSDDSLCPPVMPGTFIRRPAFRDYTELNIDLCVAIDFTSSNGDPRLPGSLHYSRDGMLNDYEESILAIGSVIEKYSQTKMFPCWGFGAKFNGVVRHIFQCGPDANSIGTDGILNSYRSVFETDLIMSGPTELQSVIKAAAARAKKSHGSASQNYSVLLCLTDGIVDDLEAIQRLVRSYQKLQLPLSLVVVGIGRADFSAFHAWSDSPAQSRGNFKFLEFRHHQFEPHELSRNAIAQLPLDIVENFVGRNIMPSLNR